MPTAPLPLTQRHVLAFARRYALDRATGVSSIVVRELLRVWLDLPQWEQEQHQKEIQQALRHAGPARQYRADWEQVLALPVRLQDNVRQPEEVQLYILKALLKSPGPHQQKAREYLQELWALTPGADDALTVAAIFYQQTPLQAASQALKRDRDRIQDELERVSQQLLDARRECERLRQGVAVAPRPAQKPEPASSAAAEQRADQKIAGYMQHAGLLENACAEVGRALQHPTNSLEFKQAQVRRLVSAALKNCSTRKKRLLGQQLEAVTEPSQ